MNKVLMAATCTMLASCGVFQTSHYDQVMEDKVKRKASFDLQCPQNEIQVVNIDRGSFGAVGCEKRINYVGLNKYCMPDWIDSYVRDKCVIASDSFSAANK